MGTNCRVYTEVYRNKSMFVMVIFAAETGAEGWWVGCMLMHGGTTTPCFVVDTECVGINSLSTSVHL